MKTFVEFCDDIKLERLIGEASENMASLKLEPLDLFYKIIEEAIAQEEDSEIRRKLLEFQEQGVAQGLGKFAKNVSDFAGGMGRSFMRGWQSGNLPPETQQIYIQLSRLRDQIRQSGLEQQLGPRMDQMMQQMNQSAQPAQDQPQSAQPTQGQPTQGQPTQGQPTQGQPTQGQPQIEVPFAGTKKTPETMPQQVTQKIDLATQIQQAKERIAALQQQPQTSNVKGEIEELKEKLQRDQAQASSSLTQMASHYDPKELGMHTFAEYCEKRIS